MIEEPEDELEDDDERDIDDDLDFDDAEGVLGGTGLEPEVTVNVTGLSLYTRHGVTAAERELGQRLVFDVAIEIGDAEATVTDRVQDTVDYADVCEQVSLAAQERSYHTLERLCGAVADRLLERYAAETVRVKAAKPEPPIPLAVDEVSVEVEKQA